MHRYTMDESGERMAVILSVEEYEVLVQIGDDAEDERIATDSMAEMRALRNRFVVKAVRSRDEFEAEIEREAS